LSFTDQVMLLGHQATGQEAVVQVVWVYEHPVDYDELRRFHRDFGHGLMGRRIECSPLPFGRHRWVADPGPVAPLAIAPTARPRAELGDWVDERTQAPIDPEAGPAWHMGVLPMTDGSTAVSLVAAHCVVDGGGFLLSIAETVSGRIRDFGYPPPGQRTLRRALAADAAATVRDLPEMGRALAAGARLGIKRRKDFTAKPAAGSASPPVPIADADADRNIVVPAANAFIALTDWDERAKTLGGNNHSLLAGVTARLSHRLGRYRAGDGLVTLNIPINDRGPDDTRANAVLLTDVEVDPRDVTTDLTGTRTAIRTALTALREQPDETLALLPLTPLVPKAVVRRGADALFGFSTDFPASCSNMGDVDPAVPRVDGTEAEYVMLRGVDRYVTKRFLQQRGGLLTIVGGRVSGRMNLTVVAYQPDGDNTKAALRELVAKTLAEFDLTGVIE